MFEFKVSFYTKNKRINIGDMNSIYAKKLDYNPHTKQNHIQNKTMNDTLTEEQISLSLRISGFINDLDPPNEEEIENIKKELRKFKYNKDWINSFTGKQETNVHKQIIAKIHCYMKYGDSMDN